jgi:basic amino acid/polyamine antiporter, APA family
LASASPIATVVIPRTKGSTDGADEHPAFGHRSGAPCDHAPGGRRGWWRSRTWTGARAGARSPAASGAGRRALLFFVVGDILGAGIYALTGAVAAEVGSAVGAVPPRLRARRPDGDGLRGARREVPQAAGAALYANKAFGRPFVTFLVAFAVMMSGVTSAAAAARSLGGDYLAAFVSVPTVLAALPSWPS